MTEKPKLLFCSFCGKSQQEVEKLVAGPSVFICNECVDLCNDIVQAPADSDDPLRAACRLCRQVHGAGQMLRIDAGVFLCQACIAVVYEKIRQYYLHE